MRIDNIGLLLLIRNNRKTGSGAVDEVMRMKKKPIFLLVILIMLSESFIYADGGKKKSGNILKAGIAVRSTVKINADKSSFSSFKLNVPESAYGIRIILDEAMEDLDLFVLYGHEINDYNYVDALSESDSGREELIITRLSDPPLSSGEYYLDVAYRLNSPPVINGKPAKEIPFTIRYDIIDYSLHSLRSDEVHEFVLEPSRGMMERFKINVPATADYMRVDIIESSGDVDFLLGRGSTALTRENSDYIKTTFLSREHIMLSRPELQTGYYFMTVFERMSTPYPVAVKLKISYKQNPPEDAIPKELIGNRSGKQSKAMAAAVEIISEHARGSGCIVSSSGYILTNYHVIERIDGKPNEQVWIAVNENDHKPPVERFRAKLVDYRKAYDLALLKIDGSFYGSNLPENYRFPFIELGDDTNLIPGDKLNIIGYPGIGGTGARVTISLTSGIVSGFEQLGNGFTIKTDSVINYGNSGGAALDEDFRLIGLPTVIIGEGTGQMGFIHPLNLLPAEWYKYIGAK
jgi:S1-C subfamily serine protease